VVSLVLVLIIHDLTHYPGGAYDLVNHLHEPGHAHSFVGEYFFAGIEIFITNNTLLCGLLTGAHLCLSIEHEQDHRESI